VINSSGSFNSSFLVIFFAATLSPRDCYGSHGPAIESTFLHN
jgi:hypothetical protein